MNLESEQLESMAAEFDNKADNLRAEGNALLKQAEKAKKAANHIRQVLCILDPEEFEEKVDSAIDDDNLEDETAKYEISGKLSHSIVKTVFKKGGCHINDIVGSHKIRSRHQVFHAESRVSIAATWTHLLPPKRLVLSRCWHHS